MMGRAHALSGYAGGMLLAESIFMAPWDVRLMSVAIVGGGALLPDLDQVSSTASRSLGPITKVIAKGIAWSSITIYHATRLPGDSPSKENPHRLITHVPVGSVTFGVLAAVTCLASPYAGAVTVGLMVALGVRAVPTLRHAAQDHLPAGGVGLFLAATVGGWWEMTHHFAWWWVVPLAVTLGCYIHREGDWCTVGGVPRRLWPLPEGDQRWKFHHSPHPWKAGDDTEVTWVTPGYALAALIGASWVSGLDQLLITAWMSRNG
jgi:hypothetical protein